EKTRDTISGIIRAVPVVGGYEGAITGWLFGDDEKKSDKINDDLDKMRESAERLAIALGAKTTTVKNPLEGLFGDGWVIPSITITDQDDVVAQLRRAQPALDALGITIESFNEMDI